MHLLHEAVSIALCGHHTGLLQHAFHMLTLANICLLYPDCCLPAWPMSYKARAFANASHEAYIVRCLFRAVALSMASCHQQL